MKAVFGIKSPCYNNINRKYLLLVSIVNFSTVFAKMSIYLSTMPLNHGKSPAFVFRVILNSSAIFKNKLLLNSLPLSGKITPGAPNMTIQFLMKASTISSFRFERTTAALLKRVALSVICKKPGTTNFLQINRNSTIKLFR